MSTLKYRVICVILSLDSWHESVVSACAFRRSAWLSRPLRAVPFSALPKRLFSSTTAAERIAFAQRVMAARATLAIDAAHQAPCVLPRDPLAADQDFAAACLGILAGLPRMDLCGHVATLETRDVLSRNQHHDQGRVHQARNDLRAERRIPCISALSRRLPRDIRVVRRIASRYSLWLLIARLCRAWTPFPPDDQSTSPRGAIA